LPHEGSIPSPGTPEYFNADSAHYHFCPVSFHKLPSLFFVSLFGARAALSSEKPD